MATVTLKGAQRGGVVVVGLITTLLLACSATPRRGADEATLDSDKICEPMRKANPGLQCVVAWTPSRSGVDRGPYSESEREPPDGCVCHECTKDADCTEHQDGWCAFDGPDCGLKIGKCKYGRPALSAAEARPPPDCRFP